MQRIRIGVVRRRSHGSTDGFQVYGGGGEIDWAHPVTARRQLLWPDVPPPAPHLEGGHLLTAHLDTVGSDGHGEGVHLLDHHLMPAAPITWQTRPFVFGRFRHAIVMEDDVGNLAFDLHAVHETVINARPLPAYDLRPLSQDAPAGEMTFAFTPSERLIG